jgi:aminocarboxymuconate-semialdehyde decarboxylase
VEASLLIDLHAHAIPAEFPAVEGWPTMGPAGADGERLFTFGPVRYTAQRAWFDAEQRLAAMAASGVTAEVISPFPPLLNYRLPAPSARDLGRWINDFIAGLCQAGPGRFFGLGTVPLQDPDLAAAELSEVAKTGLAGVEIGSTVDGASLDDDRFEGFFAEAERLRTPIFVHAAGHPDTTGRVPAAAVPTFGMMTEIGLAAAAVVTGGVAENHPGLRLAFSHGAGGFPLMLPRANWFWGRTWNEEPPAEPGVPGQPSPAAYARRFFYDALVFDRRALRFLIDMIGPGQLLVGSDFPAMPREQPAGRTLRSMGLPGPVLDQITWDNCFRFLGIDPPETRADI